MGEVSRVLTGRKVIYSDYSTVTDENVFSILSDAFTVHQLNRSDIDYLYKYYRGNQPILQKVKKIREEINNKIVENRANQIVSFKTAYLLGEPIQYVARGEGEPLLEAINRLNSFVFAEDKAEKDRELADWLHICGTSYRLILPDKEAEEDEAPFEIYTLDPRNTFVVYHNGLGNKPLMGVTYVVTKENKVIFSVYTDTMYYEIENAAEVVVPGEATPPLSGFIRKERHYYGDVPIIEYPANTARLGAFEIVVNLLDAINTTLSNRVDGLEQFVQSLLVLKNVDIESEEFKALKELGGIKVPADGDAKYLIQELNQTQTQTLVDSLVEDVLVICGMPYRPGGSSASITGTGVLMRDGWAEAEARAKDTELMFKQSEKRFLQFAVRYVNSFRPNDFELRLSEIEIRFTRRNYENIQTKAQVLTTLLNNDNIHPLIAYEYSGMFADPLLAYTMGKAYKEETENKKMVELQQAIDLETKKSQNEAVPDETETEETV